MPAGHFQCFATMSSNKRGAQSDVASDVATEAALPLQLPDLICKTPASIPKNFMGLILKRGGNNNVRLLVQRAEMQKIYALREDTQRMPLSKLRLFDGAGELLQYPFKYACWSVSTGGNKQCCPWGCIKLYDPLTDKVLAPPSKRVVMSHTGKPFWDAVQAPDNRDMDAIMDPVPDTPGSYTQDPDYVPDTLLVKPVKRSRLASTCHSQQASTPAKPTRLEPEVHSQEAEPDLEPPEEFEPAQEPAHEPELLANQKSPAPGPVPEHDLSALFDTMMADLQVKVYKDAGTQTCSDLLLSAVKDVLPQPTMMPMMIPWGFGPK
jgi:hypothetical protein